MTPTEVIHHLRRAVADLPRDDGAVLLAPEHARTVLAEIDRLRAAQAAVVAAWDDDDIGRIDGALIDALRGAR